MGPTSPTPSTDVSSERARYYRANRWTGPAGSGSAAALWVALVNGTDTPPRHLAVWLLCVAGAVGVQIAGHVVPALARRVADDGLPYAGHIAHAALGVAFGSTLWLDLDATRNAEFRWITLACLFAMSAGVVAGFSGVNRFGHLVAIPMWVGATSALVATGQVLAGVAGAIFAIITVRDMTVNGRRWIELFELRVQSEEVAIENMWAATHDPLTELVNRHGFMHMLERTSTRDDGGAILFVDLDHFKEVNDRFGHAAGDHVLRECGQRLLRNVRPGDVVARLGGDEFCVLLEDAEAGRVDDAAHRLIEVIEQPIEGPWGPEPAFISASIGVATLDDLERPGTDKLLEADFALYEAKRTGRRRVVRFDEQLRWQILERSGLESQLRQAIRQRSIEAYAQPVFDLQNATVVGVEFLARWQLDDGTTVSPAVFIPVAESIGLIGDLTEIMLGLAVDHLHRWQDDPVLSNAVLGVNMSPIEFRRGHAFDRVRQCLAADGVPPDRFLLEVTESHQLTADAETIDQLDRLRQLGVRLAIDDFGTGYSSLDQLLSLPVDAVKLDRSLIADLTEDSKQTQLVRSIHDLASVVSSRIVAEGIETDDQLRLLRDLGVRFGQGYLLCRPVPMADLPDAVRAGVDLLSAGTPAAPRRAAASTASSTE